MKCEPAIASSTPATLETFHWPLTDHELEHAAVKGWAQLRAERGRTPAAVERLQKKRKGCVYRLRGATPDGADVIGKRSTPERIARERAIYEHVLPLLQVSTVRYHGFVAETEHGACWIFVDDAAAAEYSPRCDEHRVLAARWLALLHTRAAELPLAQHVPEHGPGYYGHELRSARATLAACMTNTMLRAEHRSLLDAVILQCDVIDDHWDDVHEWCAAVPPTFAHGDFAPKNMRVRHEGDRMTLLPFDWGSAGWGTPAVDLAQRGMASGDEWDYWAHVDLDTYAREVRRSWPRVDIAAVKRLSIAGKLFRTLVCVSLEAPSFAYDWVDNAALHMGVYRASLDDAIRAAAWEGA